MWRIPSLIILLIWVALVALPLWILLSIAVKSAQEELTNPLGWPHTIQWGNFTTAWDSAGLDTAFFNSIMITSISVICLVVFGALAAYPLARSTATWSRNIYLYFVSGFVLPGGLGLVALYKELQTLGLLDNQLGIMLLEVSGGLPFVIFLYTGFIKTVPRELEEAALIDGAGPLRTFWQIVFPLLTPITATVIIVSSLGIWNDFFSPLLFLQSSDKQTIPVAIYSFVGQYNNQWTSIFSAIVLSLVPIIVLFLVLQRYFIRGIAGGALKG
ncbi:sugar ABC transporter permease [Dictyobacter alpinus]|uniref:Sugar ABC transporter permease n=1 Tax=Dictyobacter alpinus TaxID=2014873 RepID=A0A402BF94_9CHLR|nr:carbohydrate ABC transporter permease [Dictyobacter alpinus]GCE30009.1 sugar ABC transporter permease [Dictyobacter alpinus]